MIYRNLTKTPLYLPAVICVGFLVLAFVNDFLMLRQYYPLDHHPRLSIGRIRKLTVAAVPLLIGRKGDE
jgi:hypothetical protein